MLGAGAFDPENRNGSLYGQSRLWVYSEPLKPADSAAFYFSAEAHVLRAGEEHLLDIPPGWLFTGKDFLSLEREIEAQPGDRDRALFRVLEAYGKISEGNWEISLGRRRFDRGVGRFFKPTDFFYPLHPLSIFTEGLPGIDGAFGYLRLSEWHSLEGGVRLLEQGRSERWVRILQKSIGLQGEGAFQTFFGGWRAGGNLQGTFRFLQGRVEALRHHLAQEDDFWEVLAGLTGASEETLYHLEVFFDRGGRIFGPFSSASFEKEAYAMAGMETGPSEQRLFVALIRSFAGGRTLLQPRFKWTLTDTWSLDLGMHWILGNSDVGPLSLLRTQVWSFLKVTL